MKRRTPPGPEAIAAALKFQDATPRTSTVWRLHWLTIEPTLCRYQHPVNLARVLAEHRAAVAAEPLGD